MKVSTNCSLFLAVYAAVSSYLVTAYDPLSMYVINADTDDVIAELVEGAVIELSYFGLTSPKQLNFKFVPAEGESVKSVQFGLDTRANFRTENVAPYALCGDDEADFFQCIRLTLGPHTITATPRLTNGLIGTPLTIKFEIIFAIPSDPPTGTPTIFAISSDPPTGIPTASPTPAPSFSLRPSPNPTPEASASIDVINTVTNLKVGTLNSIDDYPKFLCLRNFSLTEPKQLNFVYVPKPGDSVKSVQFLLNSVNFRNEGKVPFALCGDTNGDFHECPKLLLWRGYTIEAIPTLTSGVLGATTTATFFVYDRDNCRLVGVGGGN